MKLILAPLLSLICSIYCVTASAAAVGIYKTKPDTIVISGPITQQSFINFKNLLDEYTKEIVLDSEGGLTSAALDIAELIQLKGLNVTVNGACISSCANYLFIAGKEKRVLINSIVAWHGGHHSQPFREGDSKEILKLREVLFRKEQLLYVRARTSLDLIIYSGIVSSGFLTGEKKKHLSTAGTETLVDIADREFDCWAPNQLMLERLGVVNIKEFWYPKSREEAEALFLKLGMPTQRVFMGDIYTFTPKTIK